jgi:hypothetical protein
MPSEPVRTPRPRPGQAAATAAPAGTQRAAAAPSEAPVTTPAPRSATPPVREPATKTPTPTPAATPTTRSTPVQVLIQTPPLPGAGAGASAGAADAGQARDAAAKAMVESWRDAWQRKDLDAYLAHYAPDFESEGMDRAAWGAYKAGVFARAGAIEVRLEDIDVEGTAAAPTVRFRQIYRSGSYRDRGSKTLELVTLGGQLKIRRESFAKGR